MLLWLWQASGPENYTGVTDNDQTARVAAGAVLISGHAEMATVEAATLALGVSSVEDAYQRAGVGWTGRRTDRGINWVPLPVQDAS